MPKQTLPDTYDVRRPIPAGGQQILAKVERSPQPFDAALSSTHRLLQIPG